MQNIPLFGSAASLISPPGGTITSGFLPLQYLPAEYLNYYLNAATQAVQEEVNVISFAGLTPGTSVQLLTALSGILTNAFSGTYVNKIAFTQPATLATFSLTAGKTFAVQNSATVYGTDANKIQTDSAIRSTCQGLLMTYVSTTSFSVGAGAVGDSTFVDMLYLSATLTKTTGSWAVGSGNGGIDTGSIAASTWYAVYLIKRTDTGVVDVIFSTNTTAPTLPTNYTLSRRIGYVLTNASSQFSQWFQRGRKFFWNTRVQETGGAISVANTTRNLQTVTSPVNTDAMIIVIGVTRSVDYAMDFGWTALADVAPGSNANMVFRSVSNYVEDPVSLVIPVDASRQIYYRATASGATINIYNSGWIDNLIN